MLKWPLYDLPFEPTLLYWLGGISIFDREETLGEALWVYNPNDSADREKIIRVFLLGKLEYLPYRHRFLMFKILEDALAQSNFDFSTQFESDYEANTSMAWDETEIVDPRGFFEDVYKYAREEWKEDLKKASLEDQSTW
ncbi:MULTISPECIES: hypothetical protein [Pseudomonas]|jgi:hypothetical protein|uniref:hypothetical protein n=1 Tax=Pseudomonas TaxID=286 RepID=UPI0005FAE1B5|nr:MULTISPECIES: hypothetical protein [Pseudomonas]KJZ33073.1 hypothetical protein VC33_28690 [Pseudomonas fluorescens]OOG11636.1 hypothetical protein BMS17_05890 [Pseudomonas sp. C9]